MKKQIVYCGIMSRLFATILDLIIVSIFSTPFASLFAKYWSRYVFNEDMQEIVSIALVNQEIPSIFTFHNLSLYLFGLGLMNAIFFAIYFLTFWHFFATTPGKAVLKMKIVDAETFQKPTTIQFIKRFIGYTISIVGIWSIPLTSKKQALHDKFAGTTVIKS